VVVRDVAAGSEKELLQLALVENIQRENLNAVDEALAYQRLVDDHNLTQDQVAAAVGKDRSSVANFLRLLKLPEEVLGDLATGALSMGHARALLGLSDGAQQREAARDVIARTLSVRETEAMVKRMASPAPVRGAKEKSAPPPPDVHTKAAEDRLRFALGTKVVIARRGQGGTIEIDFTSEAELQRLYELLTDRT
jgi:ParB family chromosome partitioning protein